VLTKHSIIRMAKYIVAKLIAAGWDIVKPDSDYDYLGFYILAFDTFPVMAFTSCGKRLPEVCPRLFPSPLGCAVLTAHIGTLSHQPRTLQAVRLAKLAYASLANRFFFKLAEVYGVFIVGGGSARERILALGEFTELTDQEMYVLCKDGSFACRDAFNVARCGSVSSTAGRHARGGILSISCEDKNVDVVVLFIPHPCSSEENNLLAETAASCGALRMLAEDNIDLDDPVYSGHMAEQTRVCGGPLERPPPHPMCVS
jgi:hypothetical protein